MDFTAPMAAWVAKMDLRGLRDLHPVVTQMGDEKTQIAYLHVVIAKMKENDIWSTKKMTNILGIKDAFAALLKEALGSGSSEVLGALFETFSNEVPDLDFPVWCRSFLNTRCFGGRLYLHEAARSGAGAGIAEIMLKYGCDPSGLETQREGGLSALALANNPEFLRVLLAAGASPDARLSETSETPLSFSIRGRRLPQVNLLLAAGANPFLPVNGQECAALREITSWRLGAPEIAKSMACSVASKVGEDMILNRLAAIQGPQTVLAEERSFWEESFLVRHTALPSPVQNATATL